MLTIFTAQQFCIACRWCMMIWAGILCQTLPTVEEYGHSTLSLCVYMYILFFYSIPSCIWLAILTIQCCVL